MASTVRPRREGAALAAASPSYARALNRVLRRLERVRTKGRRRLARARTPAGQRRITARLSRDYATLAGVAARIDPPAPARAPQRVVVGQLRRASRGFRDMSRAARARSGRRWVAARAGVRSAEGNVQAALRQPAPARLRGALTQAASKRTTPSSSVSVTRPSLISRSVWPSTSLRVR